MSGKERVEEVMEVDDRDLGRLVGRGGATVRELQAGTGCHIEVPRSRQDDEEPKLQPVKLRGTSSQVASAREAVERVLMGSNPADALAEVRGAAVLRNVDPVSMAHLAQQRASLEAAHGVRLELDASSVRVWGTEAGAPEAIGSAKAAVEELLQETTVMESAAVAVPAGLPVGRVINDAALRQLQDQTGLTVSVAKTDRGLELQLRGLAGAVREGQRLVEPLCRGEGVSYVPLLPGLLSRQPPLAAAALQRDLAELQRRSGATVELRTDGSRVDITGSKGAVAAAKRELYEILCYHFPRECALVRVPHSAVYFVAGQDDRELMRLQGGGVLVSLDRDAAELWLCGEAQAVASARTSIDGSVRRFRSLRGRR